MVMTGPRATVGDTEPCSTCGHVKEPAQRLHQIACAGLESHRVAFDYSISTIVEMLAHQWRDEDVYSAVSSERPISEADALAWLERVHAGEVPRRAFVRGERITFDPWDGEGSDGINLG